MILGNLVAIAQSHVCADCLPTPPSPTPATCCSRIVAHTQQSLAALLYYVVTYALATLGAFAVIAVVEERTGSDRLSNFDGLSRRKRRPLRLHVRSFCFRSREFHRSPASSASFTSSSPCAVVRTGLIWLVVLAIAMSAVSLYYYLQVLKRIYVANPAAEVANPSADLATISTPFLAQAAIILLAAGIVIFGCAPHLLLEWIDAAIRASGI